MSTWRIGKTHQDNYLKAIESFFNDENEFKKFRTHPHYRAVIGEPTHLQSLVMHTNLLKNNIDPSKYTLLDSFGTPQFYDYKNGRYSPNLIRYLDTISELKSIFGSLDGLNILEFGAGFGGLKYCIENTWHINNYNIIDLPEVVQLVNKVIPLLKGNALSQTSKIDLFIAEYSLTEHDINKSVSFINNSLNSSKIFIRANYFKDRDHQLFVDALKQKYDIICKNEIFNNIKFNKIITGIKK